MRCALRASRSPSWAVLQKYCLHNTACHLPLTQPVCDITFALTRDACQYTRTTQPAYAVLNQSLPVP